MTVSIIQVVLKDTLLKDIMSLLIDGDDDDEERELLWHILK